MTIPEALAAFLASQGCAIDQADKLELFMPGEGLKPFEQETERFLASHFKLADMRRFRIACQDLSYTGYLGLFQTGWYVVIVDIWRNVA